MWERQRKKKHKIHVNRLLSNISNLPIVYNLRRSVLRNIKYWAEIFNWIYFECIKFVRVKVLHTNARTHTWCECKCNGMNEIPGNGMHNELYKLCMCSFIHSFIHCNSITNIIRHVMQIDIQSQCKSIKWSWLHIYCEHLPQILYPIKKVLKKHINTTNDRDKKETNE